MYKTLVLSVFPLLSSALHCKTELYVKFDGPLHHDFLRKTILEHGIDVPVMATVAVRKKVVSIRQFSPNFYFQFLQSFLFVRSKQQYLYVLIELKIREK